MITSNHSLFFLLTLLIHAGVLLVISGLPQRHREIILAKLDISAVELNLSDSPDESQPSPPPEPSRPDPETVPETPAEPEMPTPEPIPPEPQMKPVPLPEPESVALPAAKMKPPAMLVKEPEPPRIQAPRPEQPLPPPAPESTAETPPEPDQPPSTTPESGAAAAMIDQPPRPRRDIQPRYPSGARRRGEEGAVTLDVTIGATGRTRSVVVAESSGHPELDDAARRAVRDARFTPGVRNGENVESQAGLTIIFKLR